jgi:hypothetical protein
MPSSIIGMGEQDKTERDKFENELKPILKASDLAGIALWVFDSLAFQIHCQKFGYQQATMGRACTDIGFATYQKQTKNPEAFLLGIISSFDIVAQMAKPGSIWQM